MTRDVWYAAYGSNMSRRRIGFYISGGKPDGGSHTYPGCRDDTFPRAERTAEVAGELIFGGSSKTWGGGVASFDPDTTGTTPTKVRLYRITIEQFEDIVAQENWINPGAVSLEPHSADRVDVGEGLTYGSVVRVGEIEGLDVITLTKAVHLPLRRPSVAYLRFVAEGLAEAFGMKTRDIAAYLVDKPGIAGQISRAELADHLR